MLFSPLSQRFSLVSAGLFDLPPKNGKIKSIDKFDNEFFDISSYEAALTDPQERMLLELTYEAITDAGAWILLRFLFSCVFAFRFWLHNCAPR